MLFPMKNYPLFLFCELTDEIFISNLEVSPRKNIAKIILIKPIKFYDLISIIFKRGLFIRLPKSLSRRKKIKL